MWTQLYEMIGINLRIDLDFDIALCVACMCDLELCVLVGYVHSACFFFVHICCSLRDHAATELS